MLFSGFEGQESLRNLIEKLNDHRFMKLRLRKKHLKDIYMLFREYTKNSHKFYKKTRNPIDLIPDEVKWRKIKNNPSLNNNLEGQHTRTSDSSGGSNSKNSIQPRDLSLPYFGSQIQEEIEISEENKSLLFIKSCEEVIQGYI